MRLQLFFCQIFLLFTAACALVRPAREAARPAPAALAIANRQTSREDILLRRNLPARRAGPSPGLAPPTTYTLVLQTSAAARNGQRANEIGAGTILSWGPGSTVWAINGNNNLYNTATGDLVSHNSQFRGVYTTAPTSTTAFPLKCQLDPVTWILSCTRYDGTPGSFKACGTNPGTTNAQILFDNLAVSSTCSAVTFVANSL